MSDVIIQWIPTLAVAVIILAFLRVGKKHAGLLLTKSAYPIYALFNFIMQAILPPFVLYIGIMVCLFDFSLMRGFKIAATIFIPMILIWMYNRAHPFKNLDSSLEGLYQNAATQPFLMCGYGFFMIVGTQAEQNLVKLTIPLLVALGMIYTLVVLDTSKGIKKKVTTLGKKPLFRISVVSLSVPVTLTLIHNLWFPLSSLNEFYTAFASPGTLKPDSLISSLAIAFQKIVINFHLGYKWCGFLLAVAIVGPFMPGVKEALSCSWNCLKESSNRRVLLQKMVIQGFLTFFIGYLFGLRGVDLKVLTVVSAGFASIIPYLIFISRITTQESRVAQEIEEQQRRALEKISALESKLLETETTLLFDDDNNVIGYQRLFPSKEAYEEFEEKSQEIKASLESNEEVKARTKTAKELAAPADGFIALFTTMLIVSPFSIAFFAFFSTWMEKIMAG